MLLKKLLYVKIFYLASDFSQQVRGKGPHVSGVMVSAFYAALGLLCKEQAVSSVAVGLSFHAVKIFATKISPRVSR